MILTCPNCKTAFSIPDGALGTDGRKVRCARCENRWFAKPEDIQDVPPPPPPRPTMPSPDDIESDLSAREEARALRNAVKGQSVEPVIDTPIGADDDEDDLFQSATSDATVDDDLGDGFVDDLDDSPADDAPGEQEDTPADDLTGEDSAPESADDIMARLAAGAEPMSGTDSDIENLLKPKKRRRGKLPIAQVLWGTLLLTWMALLGSFIFAEDIVRGLWPKSAVLFDALASTSDVERFREGVDPDARSLVDQEEIVTATITNFYFEDREGRETLVIEGVVENKGSIAANVPRIAAQLQTASGQVLQHWEFDPEGQILSRGGRIPFTQSVYPVPAEVALAAVQVIEGSRSATAAPLR